MKGVTSISHHCAVIFRPDHFAESPVQRKDELPELNQNLDEYRQSEDV